MTPRTAVAATFLLNGATLASWVPQVPVVQARLAVGPGTLSLALLAMAGGALIAMPLAGRLIPRLGSRLVLRLSALTFVASLPLPLLAPDVPRLALALALFGAGNGAMDVSMNAQAVAVEERLERPVMSSFHALFSVGGLAGAALAGLALALGIEPRSYMLAGAALLGAALVVPLLRLLPPEADATTEGRRLTRPVGAVLGLGSIALLALLAEGAMLDWSALYLHHSLATGPGMAAAGFAAFSLGMAAGRFAGDVLVARLGAAALVRASAALAALGLGTALALAQPVVAVAGCACVGLGLANVIPVVFGAAGRTPGVAAGEGIAAVSTAGYCGLLAGPPLIGFTAEVVTLPGALGIVVAALVAIAAGAGLVGNDVRA